MNVSVDTDGDPVPAVVLEAFFKTQYGNVVHIRVHGGYFEFDSLLTRFQQLCQMHKHSTKGNSYDY